MTASPKTRTASITRKGRVAARPKVDEAHEPSAPSKLDGIVALLGRPGGASLAEMVAATRWQPHSVRGALAGALKRKGYVIASEKVDGIRRYRIGPDR